MKDSAHYSYRGYAIKVRPYRGRFVCEIFRTDECDIEWVSPRIVSFTECLDYCEHKVDSLIIARSKAMKEL